MNSFNIESYRKNGFKEKCLMIGVVAISHGDFCQGLVSASEMIVGKQGDISTVSLEENGIESFRKALFHTLDIFNSKYDSVLVLADIKNASPFNEAYYYILKQKSEKFFLITGVNLPMLIELLAMREQVADMPEFVNYIVTVGGKTIEYVDTNEQKQAQAAEDQIL
jgi:mannose/fructose-specific phosphotransferase system component IIA